MTKQIIVLTVLLASFNVGYTQDNQYRPDYFGIVSVNEGKRVLRQCSRSAPTKVRSFFIPSSEELESLEENFMKILLVEASGCCGLGRVRNLENYGFQYLGVEIKKRRYIYINAFNKAIVEDWGDEIEEILTHPVVYCDGGESFWGILYDIEKQEFTDLAINGV